MYITSGSQVPGENNVLFEPRSVALPLLFVWVAWNCYMFRISFTWMFIEINTAQFRTET